MSGTFAPRNFVSTNTHTHTHGKCSSKTPREQKIKFFFESLDANSSGTLDMEDMFGFYRLCVGRKLENDVVRRIAQEALDAFGKGGVLDFQGFQKHVDHLSLEQKLTVYY